MSINLNPILDKNSILNLFSGVKAFIDIYDPEFAKHLKINQSLTTKECY